MQITLQLDFSQILHFIDTKAKERREEADRKERCRREDRERSQVRRAERRHLFMQTLRELLR